jgi:Protein of unknown function (DUF3179)
VYARTVNGKTLTFGVSGKLVRNSLLMYDHETSSLWSHLTGSAIQGPLTGSQLTVVPATQTRWGTWKAAYPATRVLPHDFHRQLDQYATYYAGPDSGILGRKHQDSRLSAKDKVIGIRLMDLPKAYALDAVIRAKVVNDTFEQTAIVVVATGDRSASVYLRTLNGQALDFDPRDGKFQDRQTGTTWDPITGRAIAGPMDGQVLTPVPATTSFWFGWLDFFPGTELYK